MPLSSLLRVTTSRAPAVARSSRRAVSTTSSPAKSLDSILIANRGEIALYVLGLLNRAVAVLTPTDVSSAPRRNMVSALLRSTPIQTAERSTP